MNGTERDKLNKIKNSLCQACIDYCSFDTDTLPTQNIERITDLDFFNNIVIQLTEGRACMAKNAEKYKKCLEGVLTNVLDGSAHHDILKMIHVSNSVGLIELIGFILILTIETANIQWNAALVGAKATATARGVELHVPDGKRQAR